MLVQLFFVPNFFPSVSIFKFPQFPPYFRVFLDVSYHSACVFVIVKAVWCHYTFQYIFHHLLYRFLLLSSIFYVLSGLGCFLVTNFSYISFSASLSWKIYVWLSEIIQKQHTASTKKYVLSKRCLNTVVCKLQISGKLLKTHPAIANMAMSKYKSHSRCERD